MFKSNLTKTGCMNQVYLQAPTKLFLRYHIHDRQTMTCKQIGSHGADGLVKENKLSHHIASIDVCCRKTFQKRVDYLQPVLF